MKTKYKQILFVIFLLIVVVSLVQALPYIFNIVFSIFGGIYLGQILIDIAESVFPDE